MNSAIQSAFNTSCKTNRSSIKKEVPWWNNKLAELKRKTRQLFNAAKTNGNWTDYHKELTSYSKEIRRCKRDNFMKFCETITETPSAARLHKALARDPGGTPASLKRSDNTHTEGEVERAMLLLQTHFPNCIVRYNPDSCNSSQHRGSQPNRPFSQATL